MNIPRVQVVAVTRLENYTRTVEVDCPACGAPRIFTIGR